MNKLTITLTLMLCACSSVPADIRAVHSEINKVRYVADPVDRRLVENDWYGLEDFKTNGGDCENFAIAKCELLKPRDCRIVDGYLANGRPHVVALVDGYYLDNLRLHPTQKLEGFKVRRHWDLATLRHGQEQYRLLPPEKQQLLKRGE